MGYIGNQQTEGFSSIPAKQDLTGATGTSLTLTHAVASAEGIDLFINNVRQEPTTAYSIGADGVTVTLTGSVAATDDIYVVYNSLALQTTVPPDGSVTNAKITAMAASKLTGALPALDGSALTGLSSSNVLETFTLVCNGEPITVGSGTYTPTNVTVAQTLTDSHAVITGSSIAYTPPSNATDVIYEFLWAINKQTSATELAHYAMRIDGTEISGTRATFSSAGQYDNKKIYFQWRIPIGGSASTTTGRVASWSSAKTIDMTMRNYLTSNYNSVLHRSIFWDGAVTGIVLQPIIKITALG